VIKKLSKHGNSLALIIDRPVLELLKIGPDTPLEVSTDGQVLIVAPVLPDQGQRKFEEALKKTNRQYGKMLERLA
jgi:antitoxin MazE